MKNKPRVVFDTNIYLSGLIFGGNPGQCIELMRYKDVDLFVSRAIILEIVSNLRGKFGRSEEEITIFIEWLSRFATIVFPQKRVKIVKHDPDNRILECALKCDADYVVSGDKKHLLSLKKFRGIPILSPKEFLEILFD